MRKTLVSIASIGFLATTTLVACSFSMRAGGAAGPDGGAPQQGANPTPAPAPTPQPVAGGTNRVGRTKLGQGAPTVAPTTTTSPTVAPTSSTTPTPSGVPVVNGATPFGTGTADPAGFQGSIFWIPAGTTKMPALASMQPNGFLFTKALDVSSRAFTEGFPGVDATKKENFAIRYEGPLVVNTEADYDFRVVSDDGAILQIDGTPIIDNDGVKAAATEKSGPVHLVTGTHRLTVDYFQATGNVALQVFCKKKGETADKICPTTL